MSGTLAFTRATLKASALTTDEIEVVSVTGRAAVSELFDLRIVLASPKSDAITADSLVGNAVTLEWAVGTETSQIHGTAASVDVDLNEYDAVYTYEVRLVPRLWLLDQSGCLALHNQKSIPEVITATLERYGWSAGSDFELQLQASYPQRQRTLQYKETDLAFLRRLTEKWGINFLFTFDGSKDKVVFTDTGCNWPDGGSFDYDDSGEKTGIWRLACRTAVLPKKMVFRDYRYQRANMGWQHEQAVTKGQGSELVEYGGNFHTMAEAEMLAKARADEWEARRTRYPGTSASPALWPGRLVHLKKHPKWSTKKLLVTEVDITFRQTAFSQTAEEDRPAYEGVFLAMDSDAEPRPARITPWPAIHGVLHGVIEPDQNSDHYAQLDKEGRYKVRLLNAVKGEKDADLYFEGVRMIQPHGGANMGFHFPLRPGTEVLVAFGDGDPDRPIIVGAGPNPKMPSPINDKNAHQNIIRTGSGINMVFDDGKWSSGKGEKTYWSVAIPHWESGKDSYIRAGKNAGSAEKDYVKSLKHDVGHDGLLIYSGENTLWRTVKDLYAQVEQDAYIYVDKNRTTVIGADDTATVDKDQALTVKGKQDTTIDKDQTLTVKGKQDTTVHKDQKLEVKDNQTIDVKGHQDETIHGKQTLKVHGAQSTTVDGNVDDTIHGKYKLIALKNHDQIILGSKTVVAKGKHVQISTSKTVVISASMSLTIQSSMAMTIQSSMAVTMNESLAMAHNLVNIVINSVDIKKASAAIKQVSAALSMKDLEISSEDLKLSNEDLGIEMTDMKMIM